VSGRSGRREEEEREREGTREKRGSAGEMTCFVVFEHTECHLVNPIDSTNLLLSDTRECCTQKQWLLLA
jgi:hypothetical protein